ncbi:hypothetical protein XENOCAPTIV_012973 [Xenoophorus captivus]|uniref:Uncharacterized protein n=1 Tax=Xenoophorus captivus TaxID=1517983 RepID=A0ABV0RQC5_9TELE
MPLLGNTTGGNELTPPWQTDPPPPDQSNPRSCAPHRSEGTTLPDQGPGERDNPRPDCAPQVNTSLVGWTDEERPSPKFNSIQFYLYSANSQHMLSQGTSQQSGSYIPISPNY